MYELVIKNITKSAKKIKFKDISIGSIFLYSEFPYLKIKNVNLALNRLHANCISLIDSRIFIFGDDDDVTPCKAQLEFEEVKGDT